MQTIIPKLPNIMSKQPNITEKRPNITPTATMKKRGFMPIWHMVTTCLPLIMQRKLASTTF